MKKEYINPALKISLFSGNVGTSDTSGINNGVDMVQKVMSEKNIKNTEQVSLGSFTFLN